MNQEAVKPAQHPVAQEHPWKQACRQIVLVTTIYCLAVSGVLLYNLVRSRMADPINNRELAELKAALVKNPMDEALKKKIRGLDLGLREQYLTYLGLVNRSGWLLFGGALVMMPALHYATHRKKLPRPGKYVNQPLVMEADAARSRWTVAGVAGVLVVAGWYVSSTTGTDLKIELAQAPAATGKGGEKIEAAKATTGGAPAVAAAWPSAEEFKKNWHRFRGPGGCGVSPFTNLPLKWDVKSGENIVWKSPVPMGNPSSPVIWGNYIFMSGATMKKREAYCYELATGKLLWQKVVGTPPPETGGKAQEDDTQSFGANSPVTDGQRFYATYDTCEVVAFDLQGNQVWLRNMGKPDNSYGHTTSLDIYQGKVLVQIDQGDGETGNGKSKLFALDTATGKTVWESPVRPVPGSWASPIIISTGGKEQIITSANPWLMAYDPTNGAEIWRAKVCNGEITPSPTFGLGMVFSCNEKLVALKPDGTGDVTKSHAVWHAEDGIPDICSPVTDGKYVYLLTSSGLITCYDGATGKKVWEKEAEVDCKASPSLFGDKLLVLSEKGIAICYQVGDKAQEVGRSELGEEVNASPAFADGRIIVRTKQNLYCIGQK
jgi:outer membrane protein assembly factor BamB